MAIWLLTTTGLLVTTLGVWETFMAVLHPRAVVGPVTTLINRCFHYVVRTRVISKSRLVIFAGPVLIASQVLCWATLLLLGISLLVWPQLGEGIVASGSKPTDTSFITAMYYAGFSITTLGVGDLVPNSAAMRLLTITTAGLGFSFFTLVLAYVISIYSALARRNQFACEIDYRTQRTGNSLVYLKPHLLTDNASLINQDLYTLTSNLAELLESHHFYSALHHFRFKQPRYAMSRMLRFVLEVASILRVLQTVDGPMASVNTEPADRMWHASLQMLEDTRRHFVLCQSTDAEPTPQLAYELARLLQRSADGPFYDANWLVERYAEQHAIWHHDLSALEICLGTNTGSKD